jgi:hypothetical protein
MEHDRTATTKLGNAKECEGKNDHTIPSASEYDRAHGVPSIQL